MLAGTGPHSTTGTPASSPESTRSVLEKPTIAQVPVSESDYYLTGSKLYLVLTGIGLAIFLFALDVSIISTAIPAITVRFHATTDIGWYAAAYPLCLCALQPLSGKIYANFSLKWAYFVFVGIFLLGSLLCAVATSSNMFICARAVTGVGAAGIFSGALSILAIVVPLDKRALYTAALSSLFGVATVTGPLIGGALTTKVSWRWCFYINLPIGAVTLVALALFFRPPVRDSEKGSLREKVLKIDVVGCVLFVPTVVMALLALQWGGHEYPWKSATVIGLFCGAAVLAVAFLAWEWHEGDDAMIPFSILLQRSVLLSCLFIAFMMGSYIVNVYYLPEWFQVIKDATPLHSGVMTLPAVIAQVLATIIAGLIINRTGYHNPWSFIGMAFMATASSLYTTLDTSTGHAKWITYLVFQGVGGVAMQSPLLAVQAALASRPQLIPIGISTVAFFQYFGASVFQSIALAIFQNQLVSSLKSHADGLTQDQVQLLLDAGSGHARRVTLDHFPSKLQPVLWAYNKAITNVFVSFQFSFCADLRGFTVRPAL
ncbi:putative HC-toxin efflux carrier TOXA [Cladophialophora carrionii]|uniref:Putative HC-toxin efflux carrier TOXA n=1 Tax=Cladophialophora carrionii TaxID=86049 RepID=A0A1C1C7V7_9EURO|nr:putative HC-toxin efflux carrier TOXA [Cladophialophora carrionii]